MRIEELSNGNYIKGTDSVERYLLDIIKRFFESNNVDNDSKEYIIKKAVERMREELTIDNAGVISVNGKTGNVTITLEELGGEPLISPKRNAFNVNFGTTEGTACEGDDPRLYDKRQPLEHTHEISEINGLEGELSNLRNLINALDDQNHSHDNKKVLDKLIYSGTKDVIDLILLEKAEDMINEKITDAEEVITDVNQKMPALITEIREILEQYNSEEIKAYAREQDSLLETQVKEYFDTELQEFKEEVEEELEKKISKDDYNNLIQALNTQYHILYEGVITDFINANGQFYSSLPEEINEELKEYTDAQYKIDYYITYTDPDLKKEVTTNLPVIITENESISYTIKTSFYFGTINVMSTKNENIANWADYLKNASIKVRISVINSFKEIQ